MQNPTMLIVLDGFGLRPDTNGNAPLLAKMPFYNSLCKKYPFKPLAAAGTAVGLKSGMIGNSEVGHLTLGAGRVVPGALVRLSQFFSAQAQAKKTITQIFKKIPPGRALHILLLLSDGGVHSSVEHLYQFLQLASQLPDNPQIYIHAFLDGRDVSPQSAERYLQPLADYCAQHDLVTLATVHGRFYAMDRDTNWDRTNKAYACLLGHAPRAASWQEVTSEAYAHRVYDEFIEPHLLASFNGIASGDSVLCLNFRPDRMRQLAACLLGLSKESDNLFAQKPQLTQFIGAVRYDALYQTEIFQSLLDDPIVEQTLFDEIESQQPRTTTCVIAETEKYAHVTYFFRGMRDVVSDKQQRILIPSLKMKDYKNHPAMSAQAITNELIRNVRMYRHYFYLVNYANADMVGHSGDLAATIQACKFIDQQLSLLYHEIVEREHGTMMIVADHGNAEEMLDAQQMPKTSHTANPVPFIVIGPDYLGKKFCQKPMGLSCVAPTVLKHLGLTVPYCMDEPCLPL